MTPDLFADTKPRRKPRVLMHVCDSGVPSYADDYNRESMVLFKCGRCGHESEWVQMLDSEARRGVPCPNCNVCENPVMAGIDRTTSGAIGMP